MDFPDLLYNYIYERDYIMRLIIIALESLMLFSGRVCFEVGFLFFKEADARTDVHHVILK